MGGFLLQSVVVNAVRASPQNGVARAHLTSLFGAEGEVVLLAQPLYETYQNGSHQQECNQMSNGLGAVSAAGKQGRSPGRRRAVPLHDLLLLPP